MTLFHFCPAHMVEGIKRNGLTMGKNTVYENGKPHHFEQNRQWLTLESDPQKQSWATTVLISYSRTEYRLTIDIPESYRKKLVKAMEYIHSLPDENHHLVDDWEGSDKWYIYLGIIPPKWIIGCRKM